MRMLRGPAQVHKVLGPNGRPVILITVVIKQLAACGYVLACKDANPVIPINLRSQIECSHTTTHWTVKDHIPPRYDAAVSYRCENSRLTAWWWQTQPVDCRACKTGALHL